ncbi:MAG: phage tail-type lysozyme domain-containing protein [Clostridiales Family XIII bacterium]|nr:phage tail-type lysozyme domain-containing protein [Clostridiales Family XIII bacterium]
MNKNFFRAIIALFTAGLILTPFAVISEDNVNVPNRDHFIKWTEPGDSYIRPQNVNTLKARAVSAEELGIPVSMVENPSSNRDHVWNYLLENGFTDEQAAGIMGNLRQEHGFQTSGDGLAQWIGGRRAKLMSMKDPYSLSTQLHFLVKVELAGSYSYVKKLLKKCDTIDEATRVFCNKYERPGIPVMNKRLAYAREIYSIYHKDEYDLPPVIVLEGSVDGR